MHAAICRAGRPGRQGLGAEHHAPRRRLAAWSAKDIAYLLQSGLTPDADSVGSTMAEVVRNTARLSDADRGAIAAYLKSLPAVPGRKGK